MSFRIEKTKHLGLFSVKGRRRSPFPAARIMAIQINLFQKSLSFKNFRNYLFIIFILDFFLDATLLQLLVMMSG